MPSLSTDAKRTLELLREADGPLSFDNLVAAGVHWPGDAVYELQRGPAEARGRLRLG